MRVMIGKILSLMLFSLLFFTCQKHSVYNEFIKRLQEEEPYIGFLPLRKNAFLMPMKDILKRDGNSFFKL